MRYWLIGTILVTFPSAGRASEREPRLSVAKPADVAMDANILEAGVEMFEDAVARDLTRSAVLLVARNGKVVLHQAVGWKDKDQGIPLEKNALFRMASNTKPVVATAVAMLVEDGKLKYDDNVRKHLPSFDNYRSGFIKVHHLLTHTSGLRIKPIFFEPLTPRSARHPEAPSLRTEVDRFGSVGAEEPVGTSYRYNNAGYNTLGALVEVVSGMPLEAFLKERLYRPLGMEDSYHQEVAEKLDGKLERMSVVYHHRDGQWKTIWKPGDPPKYPFVRASGGMISSALDYATFCRMLLDGGSQGNTRVLSQETVERMTTPHTRSVFTAEERERRNDFYGYGWMVSRDGVYSHSGSDGTAAWVDPENDLIVLVFTQSPSDATKRLRMRFLRLAQAAVAD